MTLRLFAFLCCLAGGGGLGWWLSGDRGAEVGLAAGALCWFSLESLRAVRTLRWLRSGDVRSVPGVGGLWGEASDRMRRALGQRDSAAAAAEQRLEAFLDAIRSSPNGVVLLDDRGRIEWCNETASNHLGLDVQRDLQQHVLNLVREPGFFAYYNGRAFTEDLILPAPGSTAARPRKLAVRLHPYGERRLLLLSRDVTAVEQAEVMRRDFVANVSHEIRTPLTVLAGFIETLQTLDLPEPERARYLKLMAQQASRMQTLVQDLLTLSRLEGSPLPGAAEWTPLAALLGQCEQEARALTAALGKTLQLVFPPAVPMEVSGVQAELLSALSNLLTNAVRYTPSGGEVVVQVATRPDGRLELAVRDTGPGIPAEHLPRLTERFYRVDRSRSRETGGTGLGLAIVKHVVQRHGGELRIESRPGAGSSFAMLLPAARMRGQVITPAGTSERPATAPLAG